MAASRTARSAEEEPIAIASFSSVVVGSKTRVRTLQYQKIMRPLSATVAMSNERVIRSARRRGAIGNESNPSVNTM